MGARGDCSSPFPSAFPIPFLGSSLLFRTVSTAPSRGSPRLQLWEVIFCARVLHRTVPPLGLSRVRARRQKAKTKRGEMKRETKGMGNRGEKKKKQRKKRIPTSRTRLLRQLPAEEEQSPAASAAGGGERAGRCRGGRSGFEPSSALASLNFECALLIRDQRTQPIKGFGEREQGARCICIFFFFSPFSSANEAALADPDGAWGTKLLQQEKAALLLPPIAPEGAERRVGKGTAGPRRSIPLCWANDSGGA